MDIETKSTENVQATELIQATTSAKVTVTLYEDGSIELSGVTSYRMALWLIRNAEFRVRYAMEGEAIPLKIEGFPYSSDIGDLPFF